MFTATYRCGDSESKLIVMGWIHRQNYLQFFIDDLAEWGGVPGGMGVLLDKNVPLFQTKNFFQKML